MSEEAGGVPVFIDVAPTGWLKESVSADKFKELTQNFTTDDTIRSYQSSRREEEPQPPPQAASAPAVPPYAWIFLGAMSASVLFFCYLYFKK